MTRRSARDFDMNVTEDPAGDNRQDYGGAGVERLWGAPPQRRSQGLIGVAG